LALLAGVIWLTGLIGAAGTTPATAAALPQSSSTRWVWQNPLPTGNDLGSVSCPTPSVCYVAGFTGAVLITVDAGTTWYSSALGTPGVSGAINCPSALVCFASAGGNLVLHTTDGGQSWSQVLEVIAPGPGVPAVGPISCPNTSTCFAIVGTGFRSPGPFYIFATTDSGATWVNQTPQGHSPLFGLNCPDTRTCYVTGPSGVVLATKDGGSTWSYQNSTVVGDLGQVSCPNVSHCAIAGPGSQVLTTANGGATWAARASTVSSAGWLAGMSCPSVWVCLATGMDNASTPNMIAIRSDDGAATWRTAYFPPIPGALTNIACATTSFCVASGHHGWIAVTRDGGTTWSSPSSGSSTRLFAVSCPTEQTCFAAGDAGVVLETTNGGTWSTLAPTGVTTTVRGISCSDTSHCTAVGLGGAMVQTADAGAHWTTIPWGATWGAPQDLFGVSCPTATHCVVVGQYSTVVVIDNGATKLPSGGFPYEVDGVSCPSATTCYIVGSSDASWVPQTGTILRSTDGGMNWTHLHSNDPRDIYAISCSAPTTCTAVDNGDQMVTSTDGTNWSAHQVAAHLLSGVSCAAPGTCVAVSLYSEIILTTDGGVTWQTAPPLTGNGLNGASCPRVGACTVVGGSGTILATRSRVVPPTVPAAAPRTVVRIVQPAIPAKSRTAPSTQSKRLVDRADALAITSTSRTEVPPEARLVWSDVLKFLQGLGAFGTAR
jgi:photosystem II stability/assembly factor-like uncharacterized protein